MSSRKQNACAFGASFSESIKFFNETSFTQETDLISEHGKLLICDWNTRECHKLSPMSSSVHLQHKVTQMLRKVSSGGSGH